MNYDAPGFRRPQQYDVPQSLDSLFGNYMRMRAEKERSGLQDIMLRKEFNGTNPLTDLTAEGRARGFAGPTITPGTPAAPNPDFLRQLAQPLGSGQGQDPRQAVQNLMGAPTPAEPEHLTFSRNTHEAALQRWKLGKDRGAAIGARTGEVELGNKIADTELKLAAADKARREPAAGGLDPAKRAELSNKLRDDLNKASTPFVTMRNYYAKIQTASKDPTGASDWALVYGFNKMLDEGSAVRDPEVQNTIDTGSFAQSLRAAVVRLESGKKLDDTVRSNLVAESEKLFRAMEPYNERTVGQYRSIAKRQGLDERDVVIDSSFIETPGGNAGASEEVELKDGKGGTRIALYNGPKFIGWKK